jgi:predicted MFS family arabinose efflux permease
MMSEQAERFKILIAGILSLILTLGIARFAYTPLLPIMQQQAGLGLSEAGWLASINYIGYLCGAITAALINDLILKDRLYRIGLIVALITTIGMGLTESIWIWSLLRFFAGLSSAAGLLLGSGLILNWLIRHDHPSELGIHFSGIGAGIAISAALVELMKTNLDWSQQWQLLSLLGVLLIFPAWRWLPPPETDSMTRSGQVMIDNPPSSLFLHLFMAVYFCAGVGYVVSATFIVAIVDRLPGLQGDGAWTFLILGMAATPACILWDFVARKTGYLNALIVASVLQIIGILLPVLYVELMMAMLGSVLFGATFIGIVSLVLTMAGRYYPTRPAKMMGKMTVTYGIAQILAPAVTGAVATYSGNYHHGLYLAAGMMVIGTMILWYLKGVEQPI